MFLYYYFQCNCSSHPSIPRNGSDLILPSKLSFPSDDFDLSPPSLVFFPSLSTLPLLCIFFIFALWFWNQTWTTRTLRPVSFARASRTCRGSIKIWLQFINSFINSIISSLIFALSFWKPNFNSSKGQTVFFCKSYIDPVEEALTSNCH